MTKLQSVRLFGRDIPLTKMGLPNLRSLNKEEREALRSILENKKKKKKEEIMKELESFMNSK
jgi:hypothetical protein